MSVVLGSALCVAALVASHACLVACSPRARSTKTLSPLSIAPQPDASSGADERRSARPSGDTALVPTTADASRGVESLRRPLAPRAVAPPISIELKRRLERVAAAIADADPLRARELALAAAADFPANGEPIELALIGALRQGDGKDAGELVERLGTIDPSNPLVVAFRGLSAASVGDWTGALGWLAWFAGEDALPRHGTVAELPVRAGELEEQAGFAALRIGRFHAAEGLLAIACEAVRDQPRRARLVGLLRADALRGEGRFDEARAVLRAGVERARPGDPISVLETLRLDQLARDAGGGDGVLDDSVARLIAEPANDAWLWRALREIESADRSARYRLVPRVEESRAALGTLRCALVMAALDPSRRTQVLDDAWLDVSDAGRPVDRVALVLSLRHIAVHARQRLVPLCCFVADWRPNDLDSVAYALLACGAGTDELLSALESRGDAAAAALRARIHARNGFPEDAQRIVDAARGERPGSKVLRVAAALSAIDLLDAGLLAAVDSVARRDDGSTDRTMALAWYALQEMPIARERAAAAVAFDGRDRAAKLCLALASLEVPDLRVGAFESVRELAGGADAVAGEAWGMRAEVVAALPPDDPRRAGGDWPSCADAGAALRALAAECESARIPLSAECLGLVEQLDPMQRALVVLARLGPVQRPARLSEWCADLAREAPALPDRRQLAGLAVRADSDTPPAGPPSRRFDWMATASREAVARYRDTAVRLRPDGDEKQSILLLADIEAGRTDEALARLASLSGEARGRLSALAARRALSAISRLAESARPSQSELRVLLVGLAARMDRMSPSDLVEALSSFEAAGPTPDEVDRFARDLSHRARPVLVAEGAAFVELLGALTKRSGDPFAAASLARAMALEAKTGREVRRRLATAAVGLSIGAGSRAAEVRALITELIAAEADPFEEGAVAEDAARGGAGEQVRSARALMRGSELFALLGRAGESNELLSAAHELAPDDPQVLNGLAYADLESGRITDLTVSRAERAATARPDDPAVLDTLGFLRYQQGRFADDQHGPGAISLFRQALRLRPNSPSIVTLDHLGDALWRSGDQQGAIKSWQQVDEVARRRYPPELFRVRMSSFQVARFGFELVPVAQFVRREFGAVVERAELKLGQVARGEAPAVADCQATR